MPLHTLRVARSRVALMLVPVPGGASSPKGLALGHDLGHENRLMGGAVGV